MITYHFILEVNNKEQVQAHIKALDDDKFEPLHPEGVLQYRTLTKDIIPLVEAAKLPQTDPGKIKPDQIQKLGKLLFESLFTGEVLSSFWSIYEIVRNKNTSKPDSVMLCLELQIAEKVLPEIAALPWEFMYAKKTKGGSLWIADAPNLRFSRGRLRERSIPPIMLKPGEPITITLVVADFEINKLKKAGINLGEVSYKPVLNRLKKLADESGGLIKLIEPVIRAADLGKIDKLLDDNHPHIVHFIGHGRFDPYNNLSGQIALVDGAGFPNWVNGEEFGNLFNRYPPKVVVLQACEGAASSAAQAYTGVASQILDQGIRVVIAMQYEIPNNTAMVFCHEFYTHLANKRFSIDQAVQEGRYKIVTTINSHNTPEFATPVLFTNSGNQKLFISDTNSPTEIESVVTPDTTSIRHHLYSSASNPDRPRTQVDIENNKSRVLNTEQLTIYIRVGSKRHVYMVPLGTSLERIIEKFRDALGLTKVSLKEIKAAVIIRLDTPINEYQFHDGAEIIILDEQVLGDNIEYMGVDSLCN